MERQEEEEGLSHRINNLSKVPNLVAITLAGKVKLIFPEGQKLRRAVLFLTEVSAS